MSSQKKSSYTILTPSLVISEASSLVTHYHKYWELRFGPLQKMGFHEVLVAREDVDSGSPAVGNRGGPGSMSLPSSNRKTCLIATSVKSKSKWHITVTKILLATALLDISPEVSTSLESDGKAEKSVVYSSGNSCVLNYIAF